MGPVAASSEGVRAILIPREPRAKNEFDSFAEFGRSRHLVAATSHRGLGRDSFLRQTGISPESQFELEQIHGANIVLVEPPHPGNGRSSQNGVVTAQPSTRAPRADAAITRSRGIALSVYTADCCALFFHDPVQEAIGLAHVGWRGAAARLPEKVIEAFRRNFRSKPETIQVGLGPHIRRCCYEVGEDLDTLFEGFIEKRRARRYLDLTQVIVSQILGAGVKAESIEDPRHCTSCENHRYFSSRREGARAGRLASLIMLR